MYLHAARIQDLGLFWAFIALLAQHAVEIPPEWHASKADLAEHAVDELIADQEYSRVDDQVAEPGPQEGA